VKDLAHLRDALDAFGGNVKQAAMALGISISGLRYYVRTRGWSHRRRGRPCTVRVRAGRYGLEKLCVKCALWLPLDECFIRQKSGALYRANVCRACERERKDAKKAVAA
jgi:hypothetical protein